MSASSDIPLGTIGTFRKFPRSELDFEPMRLEEDFEASPLSISSNIWSKHWKIVWRAVAVTVIFIFLGYGLSQFWPANSGSNPSNATTPVWSTENVKFAPENITFWQERATVSSETTTEMFQDSTTMEFSTMEFSTMESTTMESTTMEPTTMETTTTEAMERTTEFVPSMATTMVPTIPTLHKLDPSTPSNGLKQLSLDDSCVELLGNQTYREVKWLCHYCQRRGSVWNKTKWGFELETFPSSCSSNCYDNKFRRACAKRAYEWNKKTGEFGSPFNCKHCYN